MHILSKTTYIKGVQCQKCLYLTKKRPYLRDKISFEQRAIFQRGTDVGVLARDYFAGEVNMAPSNPSLFDVMTRRTKENLNNPNINVMYEAVFQYDDTLIMLDILVRDGDKWKAIEVKSSLAVSETYVNDASLQYYVLKGNNVPISDFQLMYVNADYERHGDVDLKQLFVFKSLMNEIEERQPVIKSNISRFKKLLQSQHSPEKNIGTHCQKPYKCEFIGHCWKSVEEKSFLQLTALPDENLFKLYESGITTNQQFAQTIDNNLVQNQFNALQSNTYYVDYKKLYSANTPTDMTAFLTLLFHHPAVPEFEGYKPYENFLLAFQLTSDTESISWDCMSNHLNHSEGLQLLANAARNYDKIVCFTPQNQITTLFNLKDDTHKGLSYKLFNLQEVLFNSDFYHQKVKAGFNLQNVYESVFANEKLFEHGRILFNATSRSEHDFASARNDLKEETAAIKRLYQFFYH